MADPHPTAFPVDYSPREAIKAAPQTAYALRMTVLRPRDHSIFDLGVYFGVFKCATQDKRIPILPSAEEAIRVSNLVEFVPLYESQDKVETAGYAGARTPEELGRQTGVIFGQNPGGVSYHKPANFPTFLGSTIYGDVMFEEMTQEEQSRMTREIMKALTGE